MSVAKAKENRESHHLKCWQIDFELCSVFSILNRRQNKWSHCCPDNVPLPHRNEEKNSNNKQFEKNEHVHFNERCEQIVAATAENINSDFTRCIFLIHSFRPLTDPEWYALHWSFGYMYNVHVGNVMRSLVVRK